MTDLRDRVDAAQACRFAFAASTGRTATMFVAKTLNALAGVTALHEGSVVADVPSAKLPLINFHNRKAWHDPEFAKDTAAELRSQSALSAAASDASWLVDIAFNNAPFMGPLARQYPQAHFFAIFRRCEGFVRSATIVDGEDMQPAGWPDRDKPLTDREKFISLGRLKPAKGSEAATAWGQWSAIQRNIWLWTTVNRHLHSFVRDGDRRTALFFEDLTERPAQFWSGMLRDLGILTQAHLEACVARSARKTNQRTAYQIGPRADWTREERDLYDKLALPLEEEIYG